jgi:RNA polymerase sigma-70 factor (ECF subfamily)
LDIGFIKILCRVILPDPSCEPAMSDDHTTAVVERYLIALAGDEPADPIVRALLDRAVGRMRLLCGNLLHRSYPRLARPPLNLQTDDVLAAVVERLLKALRQARPRTTREFFALSSQHMRWELNDLARRLDHQPSAVELREALVPAPASSGSVLGPDGRRMLEAIEDLPEDEREVFGLIRIQGLTQSEAAEILGVSGKTVQRRLNRSLLLLAQKLDDLRPNGAPPSP